MAGQTFITVHLSNFSLSGCEKETTMRSEGASETEKGVGNQEYEVLGTYRKL